MRSPDDEVVKLRLALVHVGRQLAGRYLHRLVAFMSHQPALAELLVLQSHVESTTKAACEIEAGWHKLAAAICDEVAAVSADCEEAYGKLARQSPELLASTDPVEFLNAVEKKLRAIQVLVEWTKEPCLSRDSKAYCRAMDDVLGKMHLLELDRCRQIEDALSTLRELLNAVANVESA